MSHEEAMPARENRNFDIRVLGAALALGVALLSCSSEERGQHAERGNLSLTALDPPAEAGAMAPRLTRLDDGALLTWLEPRGDGHRLVAARVDLDRRAWSEPRAIATGGAFFANWADVPGAIQDGRGRLVAHWLEKLGDDTYAYGVRIARSIDRGDSWEDAGLLHDDSSPTEHGFVSYVALQQGVRAFWLDGRRMEQGAPMQLRTAHLDRGTPAESVLLDDRVCECCSTDAAMTSAGPIVVYRDRSADEVRDIAYAVAGPSGFSAPALIHADGWHVGGCPVNGPAVDADGDEVVVGWFTNAQDDPRVLAAFSNDAAARFAPPIVVDRDRPLGRVDIALDGRGGAVMSWMAASPRGAEIRLQRIAPGGAHGVSRVLTFTTPARSASVPTLSRQGGRLVVAWIEDVKPARLRAAEIEIDGL